MRITTRIEWNMITGEVLRHEWFEYSGPVAQAGRDDKGKKQEQAQLDKQNQQIAADRAARDAATNKSNSAIDKLEATPGYTPEEMAGMRNRNAAVIGGAYEGAEDQLARTAAATGHENDTGLYPQMKQLAAAKARMETGSDMDYQRANADLSAGTRRLIPGLRFAPASVYGANASSLAGVNGSLIDSRMNADNSPTFGQSLLLAGIQGAGQAASGGTFGKVGGCHVAAEVFGGWLEPRTVLVRTWMYSVLPKKRAGRVALSLYQTYGERIAAAVRRSPLIRAIATRLFTSLLAKAKDWKRSQQFVSEVFE